MRVAILGSRGIPARYGGFESFADGLSGRLVEAGHSVTVYCEGSAHGRPTEHNGARLAYVNCRLPGPLRTLGYDALSLVRASRDHDVVYMLGYGAAIFCWLPRLWGAETWINMDGLEWRRAKWNYFAQLWLKIMEGLALRLADLVVFDAEALREDLLSRRTSPLRHAVISYAAPLSRGRADAEVLAQHGLRESAYHLVVCRLEPENHVLEIIKGFERSNAELPLVIVADHLAPTDYARTCREAAGERVAFLGTIYEPAELEALRAGCNTYLHGHSVGGTNPSLLEAMACGNPCVAHDNPFNREVLGEHGWFFANHSSLARGLAAGERLASDEREQLARCMQERVRERYTWERITGQYLEQLSAAARRRDEAGNNEVAV